MTPRPQLRSVSGLDPVSEAIGRLTESVDTLVLRFESVERGLTDVREDITEIKLAALAPPDPAKHLTPEELAGWRRTHTIWRYVAGTVLAGFGTGSVAWAVAHFAIGH